MMATEWANASAAGRPAKSDSTSRGWSRVEFELLQRADVVAEDRPPARRGRAGSAASGAVSRPTVQTIGDDSPCSIRNHSNSSPRSLPRRSSVDIPGAYCITPMRHAKKIALRVLRQRANALGTHGFQFVAPDSRVNHANCLCCYFHGCCHATELSLRASPASSTATSVQPRLRNSAGPRPAACRDSAS